MEYNAYIAKVEELMDIAKKDALEQAKIAWDSGAIDTGKYGDDFILPKIFITAYATRMKIQFRPLSREHLGEARNLEHFI
jgi:hypothetical protein